MIKRVDSGGQVHLVTNIRKPRKWRRYEYLESSGTLWIDTGIALSLTDKFEFEADFTYSPANGRAYPFYGTENYLTGFMAQYHYTNNNLYVVYIKDSLFGGFTSITASSRMYSKTVIDVPNKAWATIYNTTSANGTYSNLITDTTSTVKFFGNDLYSKYVAKCYYFKIKINDALVRDFVPAQYNGQYGMWDLVEDRFYPNKGTGAFTVGPEIKNYDEIYEVRKTTSLLPSGVELYDYILSSGTLWIDTNFIPTDGSTIMEADVQFSNVLYAENRALMGMYSGSRWHFGVSSSTWHLGMGNLYTDVTPSNIYGRHVINMNSINRLVKIDNNLVYTFNSSLASYSATIWLFKEHRADSVNILSTAKLYYCKFYNNNILVRNFLPCTYLGEPGMWDTVENKFYRNQGTGQFTLGNKITLKEYEYLEGTGTLWIDTGEYFDTRKNSYELDGILINDKSGTVTLAGGWQTAWNTNNLSYGMGGNYSGKYFSVPPLNFRGGVAGTAMGTPGVRCKVKFINEGLNSLNLIPITRWVNDLFYDSYIMTNPYIGVASYTFPIFGCRTGGATTTEIPHMKLYNFKYYELTNVIHDFIPVSYNGTPGLWDKVEWKFYANAGNGSFTLGPEKKNGIYPVSYLYDRTIYEEPDGSKWLRIVHHNNPSTRRFTSSDSFTTYIHTSNDLFFDASWCNIFTLWELMVKLKATSSAAEYKFRWVLNYNPVTATFDNTKKANVTYNTSSGYTVPDGSWGGLMKINSDNTYLCGNNGTNGSWWGAIGCKVLYSGGLPGWNNLTVTTGYLDLYIRIA